MIERSMPLPHRCALAVAVLLALAAGYAPHVIAAEVIAAEDEQIEANPDAQEMLDKIRDLVLPQQKRLARELIRKYPDSDWAKKAQEVLDEYRLYDDLIAAEQRRDDARANRIREYWDARRPAPRFAEPNRVEIANLTDQLVLYQIKGPSMGWAGPLQLPAGETHRFNYPVVFRRVTERGLSRYALSLGHRYVFRRPADGELPQLIQTSD